MNYVYECLSCGAKTERIRPVEERDYPSVCEVCGYVAKRIYENGYLGLHIEGGTIKG